MLISINTDMVKEHFSDGQIKGFMEELNFTYTETILYLWLFNYVSITPKERNTDMGRPMYRKIAKCVARILKEEYDK